MRVLLIEDEPVLARGISDLLRTNGFTVTVVTDGQSGLDAASANAAQIVLLDVMLPNVNGYEICRSIREQGLDVPVLMLTAKSQEEDVVTGLNLGADDYLIKPFRASELVARVRALLRRGTAPVTVVRFGNCEVDMRARVVRRAGAPVDLTAKELSMMLYLAARPDRALSRDVILNAVWGNSVFVTPRSVDRCIATLRAKVERDPHNPEFIQTLRDVGYRFEPKGSGRTGETVTIP